MKCKKFTLEHLREICKIFTGFNYSLNDEGIKYILSTIKVDDYDPNSPKQNRLYKDLLNAQEITNDGGKILDFISKALDPVNYIDHKDIFNERIILINTLLSSYGYEFRDDGKYYVTKEQDTLAKSFINIVDSGLPLTSPHYNIISSIIKYRISLLLIFCGILLVVLTIITDINKDNGIIEHQPNQSEKYIPSDVIEKQSDYVQPSYVSKNIEKMEWKGSYVFYDEPHEIKLTVNNDNVVFYEGVDLYGPTHKFECYSILKDNKLEIYFKKVLFDNISVIKYIKDYNSPLYILSYENGMLYTQTQLSSDGIKEKYRYFNKIKN